MDNPSSPVSRLPPELLVKVFEYLVIHSNPAILLQTCHRWADIASSVSSFWSRINFLTPPTPFLQRCVDQPIEVTLPSSPVVPTSRQIRAARDVLLLYSDRIRKLALDLPAGHLWAMEPELSGAFPILEDVSICVRHNSHRVPHFDQFPGWRPVMTPPSPIRHLRLLLVKTPWIPGRFQNLVEFFLHDQWYSRFDPTMEVFLGILESSPQLTVLSVANSGPRLPLDTTILPPAIRVVHLRNLQRLYLEEEDACDIGWKLIHLKIPISTNVRIFVDIDPSGDAIDPLGLALDLALPNHPGFPHLTNLHRCTYAVDIRPMCIITATNFAFSITWGDVMDAHFDDLMMPFFRRVMAAGVIEDLTIIHNYPLPRATSTLQWGQIFGTLHSLRKLRVQQSVLCVDISVWALFACPPSPALRDLQLSSLVFSEEPQWERGGNREGLGERLVNYCAERDWRGCRLEHLIIESSNPPPDLVSLLAPYVDHLEIRNEVLSDEDIWDFEITSKRMLHEVHWSV